MIIYTCRPSTWGRRGVGLNKEDYYKFKATVDWLQCETLRGRVWLGRWWAVWAWGDELNSQHEKHYVTAGACNASGGEVDGRLPIKLNCEPQVLVRDAVSKRGGWLTPEEQHPRGASDLQKSAYPHSSASLLPTSTHTLFKNNNKKPFVILHKLI